MKNFILMISLAGAMCLAGCATQPADSSSAKYEYKTVSVNAVTEADLQQRIMAYTNQGWEITSASSYAHGGPMPHAMLVMRRPKQ